MMQVAMSASRTSASASGSTAIRSSARPAARPKTTAVSGGSASPSTSNARPSCHGRARLTGL